MLTPFFGYTTKRGYKLGIHRKNPMVELIKSFISLGFDEKKRHFIIKLQWHNFHPRRVAHSYGLSQRFSS